MQIKKLIILSIILLQFLNHSIAIDLYEGFDCSGKNKLPFGEYGAFGGETSVGWSSTWQRGDGDAIFSNKDIEFSSLISNGGSAIVKGERKNQNFFAKGFMYRQVESSYEGDVYGSFRIVPGFMTDDTVVGMIFALPQIINDMSVRNGLFAICPKRWGGELGMIGAKGKTYKVVEGTPCVNGEEYLVIWKMTGLPKAGDDASVSLSFWVLNSKQVDYFSSKNFDEKLFNLAEPGSSENNICQFGRQDLKSTKRSLYEGILLVPFVYNTTNVRFDEIRISSKNIQEAVGLESK